MIQKAIVVTLTEEFLENTSYYLVDVKVSNDNHITIELDSFEGVSIDFCGELNRFISEKLDRDVEDYELEVGSAGLTEPFKVLKQYQKNIGNEVEVLTKGGQKLRGVLIHANPENFTIIQEKMVKPEGAKRKIVVEEELTLDYLEIKYTKYIIIFK